MRVLIFGATGGAGRLTTERAVASGHDDLYRTLVRLPSLFFLSRDRLVDVLVGQLTDTKRLRQAAGIGNG